MNGVQSPSASAVAADRAMSRTVFGQSIRSIVESLSLTQSLARSPGSFKPYEEHTAMVPHVCIDSCRKRCAHSRGDHGRSGPSCFASKPTAKGLESLEQAERCIQGLMALLRRCVLTPGGAVLGLRRCLHSRYWLAQLPDRHIAGGKDHVSATSGTIAK